MFYLLVKTFIQLAEIGSNKPNPEEGSISGRGIYQISRRRVRQIQGLDCH